MRDQRRIRLSTFSECVTARASTLSGHHLPPRPGHRDTASGRRQQHLAMSLRSHVAPALGAFLARLSLHGVNELSAMARVLRRLPSNRGTRSTNNGLVYGLVIRDLQSAIKISAGHLQSA